MSEQETKVWTSNVLNETSITYSIGKGFPNIDYKNKFLLEIKRHNAEVVDSHVIFTEEDVEELEKIKEQYLDACKGAGDLQGMKILPDKLWTSDQRKPKKNQHLFKVIGASVVLSEACGELLQTFNLGNTRLAKLQIYSMGTLAPEDKRFFYFLDIAEWRHFLVPEKSGKCCRYVGYKLNGYKNHSYGYWRGGHLVLAKNAENCDLDLWHDPMLRNSIFLSKRLYDALEAKGMHDSWQLYPCELA